MINEIIVFTGGTSGLGKIAAFDFASKGSKVFLLSRNPSEDLNKEFTSKFPGAKGEIYQLKGSLSDLQSIKMFCNEIKKLVTHIDLLINNAGTWNFSFHETVDVVEDTFQVNLLSLYFIIKELKPLLKNKPDPLVINTASGLHQGKINFNDIEYREKFSGFKSYRQSKLGVILLTRWFAKIDPDIVYVAHHPGLVSTGLVRRGGWFARTFFSVFGMSPEKGARTLIFLQSRQHRSLNSGGYYTQSKEKTTDTKESYNLQTAEKLIELLEKYLKESKV